MTCVIVLATGCALNKPYPEKSYYLPNIEMPEASDAHDLPAPYRIKVRNARVDAPFEGKSLVYRLTEDRWETDFYHEWLVYPRDMLTESSVDYLSHRKTLGLVSSENSLIEADYYLEGTLRSFYLDQRNQASLQAVVRTSWVLIPNTSFSFEDKEQEALWTKEYTHRANCDSTAPHAYAEATATALIQTFEALNSDLTDRLRSLP